MIYTIKGVKNPFKTAYGEGYPVVFNEDSREVTVFTKFPETIKVGAELEGEIESKEKNGKKYINFKFVKSTPSAGAIDLSEILTKLGKIDYNINRLVRHASGEDRLDRTSDGSPMPNFEPK